MLKKTTKGEKPLLSKNIVRARKALGMTAMDLAEKAGIPYPTLRDIEAGYNHGLLETHEKIAAALSLSVADLYRDEQSEAQSMSSLVKLAESGKLPDQLVEEIRRTKALESLLAILPRLTPNELEVISDKASAFIDLRSTTAKTKA